MTQQGEESAHIKHLMDSPALTRRLALRLRALQMEIGGEVARHAVMRGRVASNEHVMLIDEWNLIEVLALAAEESRLAVLGPTEEHLVTRMMQDVDLTFGSTPEAPDAEN